MKQEDTRQKILDKALELFSARGYDSVSVGEIATAVGVKAPSLYNHFASKQAIFDAIVESAAARYEAIRLTSMCSAWRRIFLPLRGLPRMRFCKRYGRYSHIRFTTKPSAVFGV